VENLKIIECHKSRLGDVGAGKSASNESNITLKFFIICILLVKYRHSPACVIVTVRKVWRKLNFLHDGIQYTRAYTYIYFNIRNTLPKSGTFLLGHPVYVPLEIRNTKRQKLSGSSMAASPRVLLPSSILLPPPSHCAFIPSRKISVPSSKCSQFSSFKFCKIAWL